MPDTGQIQETETAPEIPLSIHELKARRESKGGLLGWQRDSSAKTPAEETPGQAAGEVPAPDGNGKAAETVETKAPEGPPVEKTEPAKGDEPKASDGGAEAKPPDKDPVAALIEKYGSEDKLADAYLHLQRKFTGKAEETKELREFINGHFDVHPDGTFELKTEAAARRLGKERQAPTPGLDEKAIRVEVEQKYAGLAEDTDDPKAFLELPKTKALIEGDTKKAIAEKKQEALAAAQQENFQVAAMADAFFKANPDAVKLQEQMDEWLEELPQKTALRLLREGGPKFLSRLYHAEKLQRDLEPRIREAFEKGVEIGKEAVKLKTSGKGEDGPTSPKRELGPDGGDAGFKQGVVKAGKRGVMDALVGGR